MTALDTTIVLLYFAVVIVAGVACARRAKGGLEAYFLGGKRLPWWTLAMSGSVSNFDITGTMWIVSLLFVMGMRSMWVHWMWGVLLGAFFMAYMGKWVRRSGVMTAAEWMRTRFGEGAAGRFARATYALMALLVTASVLGYAYQGIGKFAAEYLQVVAWAETLSDFMLRDLLVYHASDVMAVAIIGVTTLYVILGGLYSVVVTDVLQTVVLTVSSVFIAWLAWSRLDAQALAAVPAGFGSLAPVWELPELAGTAHSSYQLFGAFVMMWVVKGLLLKFGGPGQLYDFQRFLAARDERDAAKIGAAWSLFLIPRWAMCMGIALLAITGVAGVSDPEGVMPIVLRDFLPDGVRGLVVAGLLAAFMSTFSSTINSGAAFVVRDLWQPFARPQAGERELLRVSYLATLGLVLLGMFIGYHGESIHRIWSWLMMALTAGIVVPNVLRWYWWRLNGWGFASGTLGGVALALVAFFFPEIPEYWAFPAILLASLASAVAVTLLTRPTDEATLIAFFRSVRPFGAWGAIRSRAGLSPAELADPGERPARTLLNALLGMVAIGGAYLAPMYLVAHSYGSAALCASVSVCAVAALVFTWYRYLPPAASRS